MKSSTEITLTLSYGRVFSENVVHLLFKQLVFILDLVKKVESKTRKRRMIDLQEDEDYTVNSNGEVFYRKKGKGRETWAN